MFESYSVCLCLYGPFCHGALQLEISTLFSTFFLWTSLQFICFFSFIQGRPTHSLHRINVWENIILNNDYWLGSIVLNHAMFPLPRSPQNKIFFRCVSVFCEQNTFSEVPFINTPNAVSNKVKWFKHGIRTMIWQKISITLTLVDKDDAKKPSCFFNFQTQCPVTFCFCIKYNVPNLQWRIAYSIDVS